MQVKINIFFLKFNFFNEFHKNFYLTNNDVFIVFLDIYYFEKKNFFFRISNLRDCDFEYCQVNLGTTRVNEKLDHLSLKIILVALGYILRYLFFFSSTSSEFLNITVAYEEREFGYNLIIRKK